VITFLEQALHPPYLYILVLFFSKVASCCEHCHEPPSFTAKLYEYKVCIFRINTGQA